MQVKDFLKLGEAIPLEVFKLSVEKAYNEIIITDLDGTILFANRALERITGYTPEEVIGKTPKIWGGCMDPGYYSEMWKCIKEDQKPFYSEIKNKKKNGQEYWAIISISPIHDKNNNLIGFIGTEEDASLYKSIEEKLLTDHITESLGK